jgi:hypothetical protein
VQSLAEELQKIVALHDKLSSRSDALATDTLEHQEDATGRVLGGGAEGADGRSSWPAGKGRSVDQNGNGAGRGGRSGGVQMEERGRDGVEGLMRKILETVKNLEGRGVGGVAARGHAGAGRVGAHLWGLGGLQEKGGWREEGSRWDWDKGAGRRDWDSRVENGVENSGGWHVGGEEAYAYDAAPRAEKGGLDGGSAEVRWRGVGETGWRGSSLEADETLASELSHAVPLSGRFGPLSSDGHGARRGRAFTDLYPARGSLYSSRAYPDLYTARAREIAWDAAPWLGEEECFVWRSSTPNAQR